VSTAFLQAWDSFETSRLAIEARWRGTVGTPSTDTEQQLFQELLNLFCNERDASSILSERMVVSFDTFGAAASQFLMSSAELRQSARLELVHRGSRVQIAPLATAPVGPIEVALWPGSPTEPARSALGTIARNLVSPAERYLVWSTALACAGQWRQAEIFAHGAQRMAELDGAGGPTLDEARLLRAEIRRLGAHVAPDADDSVPDDKQRYESAMVDLSAVSPVNRVRRIREEAGQVLEAVLRRVDIPGLADERMAECAAEIARTIDSIAEGANKARMIAMLLTLHLAAEHGSDVWPSRTASDRDAAYRSHRRLVQILEELHNTGQMDALPRRARALALVGFARFGADGSVMGSSDKAGLPAPGPGPRDVPDNLRGDLPDLIQGLTECPDAIAKLLLRELRELAEALARMHSPILLLTPIRLRRPAEYSPTVAPYVNDANDATKDVVTAVLEGGINASHIAPLERAIKALGIADARAREEGADRVTQFTLRTDLQYFRLLLLTLRPLHLRTKEAPSVVDAYQAIIADYPEATLPHCRLSLIADMCGEPDRAISTMRDALDRVDKDPFLNGPLAGPHWLQSLVRRRLAALMLPSAAQLRRCPGDGTTDGEMAAQVETLITACRLLRDAEQRDTARHCDDAHLMERRRRANNIVFYVSRLLEREGGREALNGLMLPYAIDGLVDELIPDGIEANEDPATLHTVGCYFAATGHPQDAYRAGKRIIDLVINNQQEMTGAHPADSMTEAMAWYRVGHPMTKSSTSETIMVSLST